MVERIYFKINEQSAKIANDVNSLNDYREGSATNEYKSYVNHIYDIVDKIEEKKPDLLEKAQDMADRYSRKLALYYNDFYRNEASCPSILVSGGSNFPMKKKQAQNSRRDTLMDEWKYLAQYAQKIEHLLYQNQPILSKDEKAIEKLEEKLEKLKQKQEDMKAANAYYKKYGTLEDCPVLSENAIIAIKERWEMGWYTEKPFPPYELSNNNQCIHATEKRLEELKFEKSIETSEIDYDGFTVKENKEIMRLQILFDGKPDSDVRDILKKNGFKWSPKEEAWQRQLTNNARYTLEQILPQLQEVC